MPFCRLEVKCFESPEKPVPPPTHADAAAKKKFRAAKMGYVAA